MKITQKHPGKLALLVNILKNRVIILILIGFLALLLFWTMPRAAAATTWQGDLEGTPPSGEVIQADAVSLIDASNYREQTNGVVIGGIFLVLIVVGGTVGVIRRKD
mgnify:FL=1|jgi:hypothetical protein